MPVLKGFAVNEQNEPVEGAAVYILKSIDSTVVKIEIVNQAGYFTFSNLPDGVYLLRINSVAYQTLFYGPFDLKGKSKLLDLGKLVLHTSAKNLQEVSIYENKNFIETKPGKVILNVENSIVSSGSTAYDILKSAPGVQIDAEENIRLNGKQNVLVIINGKQTFMEREALIDILKGTQSNDIEQIELISNPSAKYDAAGSGAIINIKTKKNKNYGLNGNLNLMSGISAVGFNSDPNHKLNSALSLNFRNKLINVYGSYNYADNNQNRTLNSQRAINNARRTNINVDYGSLIKRSTHTYRTGSDINIAKNHVLGAMFSGSDNQFGISKNNISSILNRNVLDSSILTTSDQSRGLKNQALNLNYKGTLGKKFGELSFDLDRIRYSRESDELLSNQFLSASNTEYRKGILLRNSSPSTYKVQSVKLDYILATTKTARLEMGLQGSQVNGDSNLEFGQIVSSTFIPDARFLNRFLIDEQIAAGYINYNLDFKNSSLYIGLRGEKTISEGTSLTTGQLNKRNYFNLFPNIQFTQNISKDNQLLFSYSRRITRPGYDNLNPFVAYLDQYSYRSGNPLLRPEFSRIAEVTHNYKNKYTATLRAKIVDDLILELNEQDDLTQVNTVISRNIDRQYLYGIELNAPVDITSWWNVNLNLQSAYEKYVTTTGSEEFIISSPSLIFSSLQAFKFKNNVTAEINGKYESPTVYGIYNFKSIYSVDFAFAKSLLDKKGTVRLRVTDLFNTASNRYTSNFSNLNLSYNDKRDTMMGQLSFSYLFGRHTVKGARKRNTGSESEQRRMGS